MNKGDLVQSADGKLGIVISINGLDAEVLFCDGEREIVDIRGLAVVLFKPETPANFVAMVDAYIRGRGFK